MFTKLYTSMFCVLWRLLYLMVLKVRFVVEDDLSLWLRSHVAMTFLSLVMRAADKDENFSDSMFFFALRRKQSLDMS